MGGDARQGDARMATSKLDATVLDRLYEVIESRRGADPKTSNTARMFAARHREDRPEARRGGDRGGDRGRARQAQAPDRRKRRHALSPAGAVGRPRHHAGRGLGRARRAASASRASTEKNVAPARGFLSRLYEGARRPWPTIRPTSSRASCAARSPARRSTRTTTRSAFHDINPQTKVHVLVIPKGAYVSSDDFAAKASDAEIAGFFRAVGEVGRAPEGRRDRLSHPRQSRPRCAPGGAALPHPRVRRRESRPDDQAAPGLTTRGTEARRPAARPLYCWVSLIAVALGSEA